MPDRQTTKAPITTEPGIPLPPPGGERSRQSGLPGGIPSTQGTTARPIPPSPVGGTENLAGSTVRIIWGDGLQRNRVAGRLPLYPEEAEGEAQVTVRFTVAPDGTVSDIVLVQKAASPFERAVLNAVRSWKFTPLPNDSDRKNQSATAIFTFRPR
ncbi:MAG: energy transducer TonB [Bacteroidota bacterium]|nr:energy transducer TonB [Bacteroidota bacterium]